MSEEKLKELEYLKNKKKFMNNLPHLYGQKFYKWSRDFWESKNKHTLLLAANQIGKSSIQIRKMVHWATEPKLWPELWPKAIAAGKIPNVFWYLITDLNTATAMFEDKMVPEFLPRNELKNHPQYGWKAHYRNKQIAMVEFNTGVKIYFQAYSKNALNLQAASVYAVFCFVAGTKVLTESGWRNIEEIKVGDLVHTNSGIRRVEGAIISIKNTYRVEFNNGSVLEGTEEHPIATYNRGWVNLTELEVGDQVCVLPMWKLHQRLSSIRERSIDLILGLRTTPKVIIETGIMNGFIEKFGRMRTGSLFLRVNIFIMSILIRLITTLQIWSVSLEKNITKSIKHLSGNKSYTKNLFVKNAEQSLQLDLLKKDLKDSAHQYANQRTEYSQKKNNILKLVLNVGRFIMLVPRVMVTNIAQKTVVLVRDISTLVKSVVKSFLIHIRSKLFVAQVVVQNGTIGTEVQNSPKSVNIVSKILKCFQKMIGSTAPKNVMVPTEATTMIPPLGLLRENAKCVEARSVPTETVGKSTVPSLVDSKAFTSIGTGQKEVFNLTVGGTPEYYAQGIKVHNCDEELFEDLYGELVFRTAAVDGYFSQVFTATIGQALWYNAFERIGEKDETFTTAKKIRATPFDCLEYEDGDTNTLWTKEKIKQLELSCATENEIQKRVYGRFVMDEGLVLSEFSSDKHMVEPYELPMKEYSFYSGVDIGSGGKSGHKGACTFLAVNSDYTKGVLFRGWKGNTRETTTASDILDVYRKKRGSLVMAAQYYDWASKDFYTFAERAGETFLKANKDHSEGWDTMNTLLKLGMLEIFDIDELQPFRFEAGTLTHEALKRKNHADDDMLDSARYIVTSIPWDITKVVKMFSEPEFVKKEVERSETQIRRDMVFKKEEDDYYEDIESEMSEWGELYDG